MSRDAAYQVMVFNLASGAAQTADLYHIIPTVFLFEGWAFAYDAAEGGTNDTVTVKIDYTTDGSVFTSLKAVNSNTAGLLDSGAPLVVFRNPGNPASAGVAWGAETNPANVRIPANATIRCEFVTAGTSPPAMRVLIYGKWLQVVSTDVPTANVA